MVRNIAFCGPSQEVQGLNREKSICSGSAISNVIFGKHNPSGKLPLTFPKVLEDSPSYGAFGHEVDTVYTEGIKVGYRYFDRPGNKASAFPFG